MEMNPIISSVKEQQRTQKWIAALSSYHLFLYPKKLYLLSADIINNMNTPYPIVIDAVPHSFRVEGIGKMILSVPHTFAWPKLGESMGFGYKGAILFLLKENNKKTCFQIS